MEDLAVLFEENKGKKIILWDLENRRFEGVIQRVFKDFVQIFEIRQQMNKIFRFSNIQNFELVEK